MFTGQHVENFPLMIMFYHTDSYKVFMNPHYQFSFIIITYSGRNNGLIPDLGVSVAVLRGEDETWQVAGQVQPSEVPDQVPVDDGVMVHHVSLRDHRVALVLQQTLQLLPQHQRAQVGNRHWLGVVESPLHAQWVLSGTKTQVLRFIPRVYF